MSRMWYAVARPGGYKLPFLPIFYEIHVNDALLVAIIFHLNRARNVNKEAHLMFLVSSRCSEAVEFGGSNAPK